MILRIGVYQIIISNNITENLKAIEEALNNAKKQDVELAVFAECALTGYPSRDIETSAVIDYECVEKACKRLENLADELSLSFIVGTAYKENENIYNRAILFQSGATQILYDKRALWGWDRDNFVPGTRLGIFEFNNIRIGLRICYEVRFPEYFRELYKENTDLNIILFYDVADSDDMDRYNMIKGHIQTRAVENVCTTISVNAITPFQTAPTAVFGPSGQIINECKRNVPDHIIYDFEKSELNFGEQGRKWISDFWVLEASKD